MQYEIKIKTENVEDFLALNAWISNFMSPEGYESGYKNLAVEGSGEPFYYSQKMIKTGRPLEHTGTPPNRNITDEQLSEYWPMK